MMGIEQVRKSFVFVDFFLLMFLLVQQKYWNIRTTMVFLYTSPPLIECI